MSQTHSAAPPAANRRGMIALTLGMASYTVNDTFVKTISHDLPFGEVIFLRGVLSVLVLTVALMVVVDLRSLVTAFNPNGAVARVVRCAFDGVFRRGPGAHEDCRVVGRGVDLTADPDRTCRLRASHTCRLATLERDRTWALWAPCLSSNPAQAPSTSGRWSG